MVTQQTFSTLQKNEDVVITKFYKHFGVALLIKSG